MFGIGFGRSRMKKELSVLEIRLKQLQRILPAHFHF